MEFAIELMLARFAMHNTFLCVQKIGFQIDLGDLDVVMYQLQHLVTRYLIRIIPSSAISL